MGNIPASGGGGGAAVWGDITGTLSNQTDLETSLNSKAVSPLTTKGDLWGFQSLKGIPNDARVPVGSDGQVLTADSAQDLGLHWATPAGAAWGSITGTLSSQTDLNSALALKAPLASPALTGSPTAPTQSAADNSTKLATTAYADNLVTIAAPYLTSRGSKYLLGKALTQPPAIGSWTWVNQNGATGNTDNGYLNIISPQTTADNWNMLVLTAPSTPWTRTAFFNTLFMITCGLIFRESSSGKIHVCGLGANGVVSLASLKYTNPTTFSASYKEINLRYISSPGMWIRIGDDGTNRTMEFSIDGDNWSLFHSIGRTDFLTANQMGVGINNNSGSCSSIFDLFHWA